MRPHAHRSHARRLVLKHRLTAPEAARLLTRDSKRASGLRPCMDVSVLAIACARLSAGELRSRASRRTRSGIAEGDEDRPPVVAPVAPFLPMDGTGQAVYTEMDCRPLIQMAALQTGRTILSESPKDMGQVVDEFLLRDSLGPTPGHGPRVYTGSELPPRLKAGSVCRRASVGAPVGSTSVSPPLQVVPRGSWSCSTGGPPPPAP